MALQAEAQPIMLQPKEEENDIKIPSPLSLSTASPSAALDSPTSLISPGPLSATSANIPRRPTRKSTLTQQQKNQKRQRATQDQLTTLEVEFNKNPTPNAAVRERIAQEINMTERSVQIWFQNRRAKIKNLAKKSIESGEECDQVPESMKRYLAMQALESGKALARPDFLATGGMGAYGNNLLLNADSPASKVMIYHLNCRSLSIGTWRRIGQTQLDLVVFYSPTKSMVTYYIQAENTGFRIEYPFSSIKNMTLDPGDVSSNAEGASQQPGGIVVELSRPPIFTMDQGSNGWFQCRDFTENQQASKVLVHHLGGHPKVLSGQLAKLVSLEAYRNRHGPQEPTQTVTIPPPPMSPAGPWNEIGHRPASQPNHVVHPHSAAFANFQNPNTNGFNMGPPPPRGHKRQRSRSVPAAMDFSQRRPAPPFMFHQHQHHHVHHHGSMTPNGQSQQNAIFAPVPQHSHPLSFHQPQQQLQQPPPPQPRTQQHHEHQHQPQNHQSAQNPIGTPFNLGTPGGYRFDFTPGPLSATTAPTPPSTEFESSLLPVTFGADYFSTPQMHSPFTAPFMSPMGDQSVLNVPTASPISVFSQPNHQQAVETPQGPQFRSASADPTVSEPSKSSTLDSETQTPPEKGTGLEHEALLYDDEKVDLDALLVDDPWIDPFNNQSFKLPFRSQIEEVQQQPQQPFVFDKNQPVQSDDFEFSNLIYLDPPNLTPEHERPSLST